MRKPEWPKQSSPRPTPRPASVIKPHASILLRHAGRSCRTHSGGPRCTNGQSSLKPKAEATTNAAPNSCLRPVSLNSRVPHLKYRAYRISLPGGMSEHSSPFRSANRLVRTSKRSRAQFFGRRNAPGTMSTPGCDSIPVHVCAYSCTFGFVRYVSVHFGAFRDARTFDAFPQETAASAISCTVEALDADGRELASAA
jgi:hypothetical protein